MLLGAGGNIALAVGDYAFLTDDQYAPLSLKIMETVRAVTDKPIRFLVNAHWHRDHTGGNENMAGAGIVFVAHDNVRTRMSTEQFNATFNAEIPPPPNVIPGHGPLAGKKELLAYRGMLTGVRDRVAALLKQGKTKEQVVAAKPSAAWDAAWGNGFMKPDGFIGMAYDSMSKK